MPRPPPAFTNQGRIVTTEDAQRFAASVDAAASLTEQEPSMHTPTTTTTTSGGITATTGTMFNTTTPSPYLRPPGTRIFSPNISPTNTTLLSARVQPTDTTSPHLRPRFIESGPIDTGMAGAYNHDDDEYEDESEEGEAETDSDSDDYVSVRQSEEERRRRRLAAAAAAGRTLGYETGRSAALRDLEEHEEQTNRERVAAAVAAGAYTVGTLGAGGAARGGMPQRMYRPSTPQPRPVQVWPDARLMTREELAAYNKKALAEDREDERKWMEEKEKEKAREKAREEQKRGGRPQGSMETAG